MWYRVIAHEEIFAPGSCAFAQCHASTVCLLPNGRPAAAWFAGSKEGAPDVDIWFARRQGDGWEAPRRVAAHAGVPCWNPVLLCREGRLLLFYKVGAEIAAWQTLLRRSDDGGDSWSDPVELVPGDHGGRGPVKNKCLVLADGALLAPSSTEGGGWRCFTDRSDDGGHSWRRSPDVPCDIPLAAGRGLIQPTLWQTPDGVVHMLMRSSEGSLYQSESRDGGVSWAAARRTALPNNNCGVDLAQLADGRLVLAHNPVEGNWGPRSPLALALSADGGHSWSAPQPLEHIPCDKNEYRAELSYPAIVAAGQQLFLTYTHRRQTIAFWQLAVE